MGTASVLEGLVRAGVAAVGARYGLLRLPGTVPGVIAVGGEPGGEAVLLTVAVQVRGDVLGSFELGGKEGGFGLADEELVRGLAEAMGAVVDEARDEDRFQGASRIARNLHDHVVQRLFATGLTLRSLRGGMGDERLQARLVECAEQLEAGLQAVRTSILDLYSLGEPGSLRRRLLDVVATTAATPEVRVSGPVDTMVPAERHGEAEAVLRAVLGAVPVPASVVVRADDDFVIEVTGDGEVRTGDLEDLVEGGAMLVVADEPAGRTKVIWRVALP